MKVEVGTFTPTGANTTVTLNDSSLVVQDITFQIAKNSASQASESTGFSDAVNNVSKWTVVSSTLRTGNNDTGNAVHYKEDVAGVATDKIVGGCSSTAFNTTGQFVFTASTWTGLSIEFIARGHH